MSQPCCWLAAAACGANLIELCLSTLLVECPLEAFLHILRQSHGARAHVSSLACFGVWEMLSQDRPQVKLQVKVTPERLTVFWRVIYGSGPADSCKNANQNAPFCRMRLSKHCSVDTEANAPLSTRSADTL